MIVQIFDFEANNSWKVRDELSQALEHLISELGIERTIQLADLIQEVKSKTGWGGVDIVIAEGRVTTLKQEISHK